MKNLKEKKRVKNKSCGLKGLALLSSLIAFGSSCLFVAQADRLQTEAVTKGEVQNIEVQNAEVQNVAPNLSQQIEELKTVLHTAREQWGCPGVSIGLIVQNKVFFLNDGIEDLKTRKPVTEDSIFCVMSLSKILTVSVLQQLVDEGKIDLEAPVKQYLPWFQLSDDKWTQEVKVRHLISHCVGLPKFSADTLWYIGASQKEILEKLRLFKMNAAPGTKYAYQNMFVGIAGLLIEQVTGQPLSKVMQDYLFQKLHMDHSSVGPRPRSVMSKLWQWISGFFTKGKNQQKGSSDQVTGHFLLDGKVTPVFCSDEPYLFEGTSGVNSTTADYLKFLMCLLNDRNIPGTSQKLLSDRAWKEMSSSQVSVPDIRNINSHFPVARMKSGTFYYGNGLFSFEYGVQGKFTQLFMHEGAGCGWRSLWMMAPDKKIGFVILTNYGSVNTSLFPEGMAYTLLDCFLNLPKFDWNQWFLRTINQNRKYFRSAYDSYIFSPPPADSELVGNYDSPIYGPLKVSKEKGTFILKFRGRKIPLHHIGNTVFTMRPHDLTPRFGDDDLADVIFYIKNGQKTRCDIRSLRESPFTKQ